MQRLPPPAEAQVITREMAALFGEALDELTAGRRSPTSALLLYRRFAELMPVGPEGDEAAATLSAALLATGLATAGTGILDDRLDLHPERDARRARLGLMLARLHVAAGAPDRALATLVDSTPLGAVDATLTADRQRLMAEALAANSASPTLADRPEAGLQRARAAFDAGDWPAVRLAASPLEAALPDTGPIDTEGGEIVLMLATAARQLGDTGEVRRLAARHAERLPGERDAAFSASPGCRKSPATPTALADATRLRTRRATSWRCSARAEPAPGHGGRPGRRRALQRPPAQLLTMPRMSWTSGAVSRIRSTMAAMARRARPGGRASEKAGLLGLASGWRSNRPALPWGHPGEAAVSRPLPPPLVGAEQDRLGQVERRKSGLTSIRRAVGQPARIVEAGAPARQADPAPRRHLCPGRGGGTRRVVLLLDEPAVARGGRIEVVQVGRRLCHGRKDLHAVPDLGRTRSRRHRLGVGPAEAGRHQAQLAQTEIQHGASGRADVLRELRAYEDDDGRSFERVDAAARSLGPLEGDRRCRVDLRFSAVGRSSSRSL